MADTARILLNKPLDIKCPACGQELIMIIAIQVNGSDGVDSVSYGDEALNGGRKATVSSAALSPVPSSTMTACPRQPAGGRLRRSRSARSKAMPEEFALDMVRRDLDRPHDYEVIYGPNYREHTLRSLARQLDEMADSQNEHMAALVGLESLHHDCATASGLRFAAAYIRAQAPDTAEEVKPKDIQHQT